MRRIVMVSAIVLALALSPMAGRSLGRFDAGCAYAQVFAEQAVGVEAAGRTPSPVVSPRAAFAPPRSSFAAPSATRTAPSAGPPHGWVPVELRYADAGCMAYGFERAGRLLVPLWSLKALGATAGWDDFGRLIVAFGPRSVFLWPGVRRFTIHERGLVTHDGWRVLPRMTRGDLFVPLREMARALGLEVVRDGLALRLCVAPVRTHGQGGCE